MSTNPEMLKAQDAADLLMVHVETLRRMARKGQIPAFKMGKDWRFRKDTLLEWAAENPLNTRSSKVLVIDDDESHRKLVGKLLADEGIGVVPAEGGARGLALLQDENIGVVILDLKMPGMNGPEFLREMRKTHAELPVIIVTGYPDGELMADAMQYGPFMLFAKPIDRKPFLRVVGDHLDAENRHR